MLCVMGAITNKIAGKLKKVEGKVTGDKVRTAQGAAQDAAGTVGLKVKKTVAKAKIGIAKAKVKAKVAVTKVKAKVAKTVVKSKVGRKAIAAKVMP